MTTFVFLTFQGCEKGFIMMCGVGYKHTLATLIQFAVIGFQSDHTINRVGFNMSFSQINGCKFNANMRL